MVLGWDGGINIYLAVAFDFAHFCHSQKLYSFFVCFVL